MDCVTVVGMVSLSGCNETELEKVGAVSSEWGFKSVLSRVRVRMHKIPMDTVTHSDDALRRTFTAARSGYQQGGGVP
jgi:hypothetical protein